MKLDDNTCRIRTLHANLVSNYEGQIHIVQAKRKNNRNVALMKIDGVIFCTYGCELDVRQEIQSVQRAWCKLSGVSFTDLKAAIAEKQAKEAADNREDAIAELEHDAKKLGFRLEPLS